MILPRTAQIACMTDWGWLWRCAHCDGTVLLVVDTFAGRHQLALLIDEAQLGTADLMLRSKRLTHGPWPGLLTSPPCQCEQQEPVL